MATHKASKSGLETKHKASYDVLERECKKRRKRLGRTQDSLESMESELQEVHAHWADCRHTTKILQEALQTPKENGSQNMHGNHRSLLQDSTFQDDEIAYQQATNEDNQYLQEEVNTYRCDLQDCMEGLRSSQTAEQKAKVDLAAARQELELCKDALFRLQPVGQVPDSQILNDLDFLILQVGSWIDAEIFAFEKAHPEGEADRIFFIGNDKNAASLLRRYPGAGEHLVAAMIHIYLQAYVLDPQIYLLGLQAETRTMLQRAEAAMTKLDPPRDAETVASWRSETLKALSASTGFVQQERYQLSSILETIFQDLSETFPVVFGRPEGKKQFYKQVLLPAAKLANAIHTSSTNYVFDMPCDPYRKWSPLSVPLLQNPKHTFIDVNTRKTLKPQNQVVADKHGILGNVILPLHPGLYRQNLGKDETLLRRGSYLVELHRPLGKRQ